VPKLWSPESYQHHRQGGNACHGWDGPCSMVKTSCRSRKRSPEGKMEAERQAEKGGGAAAVHCPAWTWLRYLLQERRVWCARLLRIGSSCCGWRMASIVESNRGVQLLYLLLAYYNKPHVSRVELVPRSTQHLRPRLVAGWSPIRRRHMPMGGTVAAGVALLHQPSRRWFTARERRRRSRCPAACPTGVGRESEPFPA
jgi:hypothetical protein